MSGAQSIYILASRAMGQQKLMDAIANNVANSDTAGYKRQGMDFKELIGGKPSAPTGSFVKDQGYKTDFSQGGLDKTENPFDLAIVGNAFFAVQSAASGEINYTRAGNFTVSSTGRLQTYKGDDVLDQNNAPINIPIESTQVTVSEDGTISNQDGQLAKIGAFNFATGQEPIRAGNNLFKSSGPLPPTLANDTVSIRQGYIETSNVNPVLETVTMTEASRNYQNIQQMISRLDDIEQEAIRSLPRLTSQ